MIDQPWKTIIASSSAMGMASLELFSSTTGHRRNYPLDKPIINIGRDPANDIVIEDPSVSAHHLQVMREGSQYVLVHPHPSRARTANGMLYQGRKIRGDESFRKVLERGDVFRIGDADGALVTLSYQDGSGIAREMAPAIRPIRLGDPVLTIGRRPDNNVVLPHAQVSGVHARLVREGGAYRILDMNSTNHVYVNAQLVTNQLLKLGDEIRIGPYRLVYESTQLTQYDESNYIRIDALNLRKVGNNQTILLNNISVSIPPRTFVALVGGSGAGKSTLLDAICGLRPAQQGKILYNGQDYYHNLAAFSTQIGYVPQDDIVHRDLTVERALYYAAKNRLPKDFTDEQIQQRIKEVLEDVELTERRKLLIKKLSGGQRKRVSIALELLANPSLFFLDEPTSGLDPGLDRKMMVLLRKLADKGHTVILVTHATNNINVCDYVCFLARGGRLAYFGPPEGTKTYFGKTDFAEIYSNLEATEENPNIPEEAEARFKVSKEYQEYVAQPLRQELSTSTSPDALRKTKEIARSKRGKPIKQFLLLSQRNAELLKNDRATLMLLLLQAPLIALFLMLLVKFEVKPQPIFDQNNIVTCASVIQTSSGPVGLTSSKDQTVPCDMIVSFLKTNSTAPQGSSMSGVAYAKAHGGEANALQDFITTASGLNAQRVLFLVAFVAVLFGVLNSIREIVKEAAIYRRERAVNLGIAPYIASKMLLLGVLALFQSGVLVLIVNAFEPFTSKGVLMPLLLENYITLALAALSGLMMGLLVSALAPNEDTAQSLLPFLLIPQVIFAGVEIPLKDGVTQIAAMFFPTRWAMVALGTSQGIHGDKLGSDALLGSNLTYHGTLFSIFSQSDATQRLLLGWGAMVLMILLCAVGIGLALKRKDVRV